MDPYAAESNAQAAAAAKEAAAGKDLASDLVMQVVIALVIGVVVVAGLGVDVIRLVVGTVRSVQRSVDAMAGG